MSKKKFTFNINTWLPVFMLIFFLLVFGIGTIATKGFMGSIFSPMNLKNLFNQSAATIIAALGMLFVATMGSTDITIGVVVALAGTFGLMATNNGAPSIMFIIISLALGLLSGLLIGFCNAKLKVNSFMASLAIMMAYRAAVIWIVSDKSFYVPEGLRILDNIWVKLIIVIVLIAIIYYVFKFTRFGNYVRGIGENEVAIRHTGVNVEAVKIVAFIISGVLAAIAGIFTVVRQGGVSSTIGTGFEMKIMMALFIGGIPVQGGEGAKVYKIIFGALSITLLEIGLPLLGAQSALVQLIKGLFLLGAVYLTNFLARKMAYVGTESSENRKLVEEISGSDAAEA